jgi:serine/threonine protein kinase
MRLSELVYCSDIFIDKSRPSGEEESTDSTGSFSYSVDDLHREIHSQIEMTSCLSHGAYLTYAQVVSGGESHVVEEYTPVIHRAANPDEIASMILFVSHGTDPSSLSRIVLVRSEGAANAYALTHAPEQAIDLYNPRSNRPREWGKVFFASAYPAVENHPNAFHVPTARQQVAIKRLNKVAVKSYLQQHPDGENPYKELARMEEFGDNVHVLRHIEALEDDIYLYIVMPKGLKTLVQTINWHGRFSSQVREIIEPAHCHRIFCKIMKILCYLEHFRICHHDISPDNFLFLEEDNLVLFDFALSNRIPINPSTGHRTLISRPRIVRGTIAWMDPVVFHGNHSYDGVAMDLYAAAILLYNMLTNESLYVTPMVADTDYNHFIHLEGMWSRNQQTIDNLHGVFNTGQNDQNLSLFHRLYKLSGLHLNISAQAMDLLKNMLNENPARRFTLAEVMESKYVTDFQD